MFHRNQQLPFLACQFFAPTATYMMEWLRDKVMWQRLTINEILFKQKGAGISSFCQRRVSAQEDPEKRRCFRTFDHKFTEEGKWETELSMKACEGYKVIEKFDKVCS